MIRVEIVNDHITRAFLSLGEALDDLTPLMEEIGDYLVLSAEGNIINGTSPDGTPFAPRSETTVKAYEQADPPKVPGGGPLWLTGTLKQSMAYELGRDYVDWGSNLIYAAVMQFGAKQGEFGARIGKREDGRDFFMTIPWGDIPARPFLGIGPDDETAIVEIIAGFLEEAAQP